MRQGVGEVICINCQSEASCQRQGCRHFAVDETYPFACVSGTVQSLQNSIELVEGIRQGGTGDDPRSPRPCSGTRRQAKGRTGAGSRCGRTSGPPGRGVGVGVGDTAGLEAGADLAMAPRGREGVRGKCNGSQGWQRVSRWDPRGQDKPQP
ncbi:hypothetical protein MPTK1_5g20320 [Marchantia polymorpha subsp. ruderalis]|uniref:Uncharacterized protein n=2 Tax=Marchantia polymorpha TaxID=3197 RepID=A0AAF6BKD1_MARPO|nr:hypothetical protein MARPO_0058s0009 [Marchantia polymorpha]BBN12465.1 hypothetical protein Mp_5g20320 [Marchantia polymorpha subsp. ruderalis]|eukprot:PTQ37217.1 hypothetical protein MARPO_0058s0009 [Marchantia polymorpha]